jgi:hypothetical protein
MALTNISDVIVIGFAEYLKNGSGKDAQENGLFVYFEDRKIHSLFIIDRS